MLTSIKDEVRNALWGCLEISLYLRKGATRFSGKKAAFYRSLLVPLFCLPLIIWIIPDTENETDRTFIWRFSLMCIQMYLGTAAFATILYGFKGKNTSFEDFLKCLTAYNWLTLSGFVVNIPLILLALSGVNTWDDVLAMMLLLGIYTYSFLTFMIIYVLRVSIFTAVSFAVADLLMGEVISNITTYFMVKYF